MSSINRSAKISLHGINDELAGILSAVKRSALEYVRRYYRSFLKLKKTVKVAFRMLKKGTASTMIYQLPDDWFNEMEVILEDMTSCISDFGKKMEQYNSLLPNMENYHDGLNLLVKKMEQRPQTSAIRAFSDLINSEEAMSDWPYLETLDKCRDYVLLSQIMDNLELARNWKTGFVDWIHDSRHYIDRIRALSIKTADCYVSAEVVIALDALQAALFALLSEAWFEIVGRRKKTRRKDYEPCRLFLKFQHCFNVEFDRIRCVCPTEDVNSKVLPCMGMGSVALNIYENAAKYIPKDEQNYDVETKFRLVNGGIEISVSSLGPYVPEDELEKIFEIRYRGTTANIGSTSGNGLGLAHVKRICDAAGYSVRAESKRKTDGSKWGLFTIIISIPRDKVVDCCKGYIGEDANALDDL